MAQGDIILRVDLGDLVDVVGLLRSLHRKVDKLMATQAEIDALTQGISTAVDEIAAGQSELVAATSEIQDEIDALKAANPALDVSALETKVNALGDAASSLGTAVQGVQSLVPAPAA